MKNIGFEKHPFWCSYNKTSVNYLSEDQVKLILNVPNELLLLSDYAKWIEYLDYSELDFIGKLWKKSKCGILSTDDSDISIQAIIPYIKYSWIKIVEFYNYIS